jgi:hypothetical protein
MIGFIWPWNGVQWQNLVHGNEASGFTKYMEYLN